MFVYQVFKGIFSISVKEHEFLFYDTCDMPFLFSGNTIIEDSEFSRIVDKLLD